MLRIQNLIRFIYNLLFHFNVYSNCGLKQSESNHDHFIEFGRIYQKLLSVEHGSTTKQFYQIDEVQYIELAIL